jgi:hypothetical protein
MGQNLMIVNSIEAHRIAITANPDNGDRKPKKAQDHITLNTSWAAKI